VILEKCPFSDNTVQKKNLVSFRDSDCVFGFFPTRQVSLMNLPKTLTMPLFRGFGKKPQGILRKLTVFFFLVLSLVFKTVFGIFLAPLACLKSVI
jgi:hypothetical protein